MQQVQVESRSPRVRNFVKQLLAVAFGVILLWLAFRGCNFAEIWSYAKTTNLLYLCLVFVSCIVSHALRAWRWIYLLQPIAGRRISVWNSFVAIMTGYAVNVVIPRGGEVARLLSISRTEKLPWAGVLPTMLIDRMLDLVMLGLLLGLTLTSLPKDVLTSVPLLVPVGTGLAVGSLVGLFVLPFAGSILKRVVTLPALQRTIPSGLQAKLVELAEQFQVGTQSLTNPSVFPIIAISTPAIWFFYWLNTYLAILAFGLQTQINLVQSIVVFTIGSVGVLVPTPGSVGTFHFLVSQGLIWTTGVNKDLALAYASVLHLCCFIVAICIPAAICVGIQSLKTNKPS